METFAAYIRFQRISRGFTLRKVAADLKTDPAILSKAERGIRPATKELVLKLAEYYSLNKPDLVKIWMQSKWSRELEISQVDISEPVSIYSTSPLPTFSEIKRKITDILRKDKRILKAFLFGSFSRNEAVSSSDIDILIRTDKTSTFTLFDLAEITHESEKALGRKIDIITENGISKEIMVTVSKNMKVLYEKK